MAEDEKIKGFGTPNERIEKLEKSSEEDNESFLKLYKEVSNLEKKVDAWIDDIRIGNKERFKQQKEISEMKERVEGVFESIHGISDGEKTTVVATKVYKEVVADIIKNDSTPSKWIVSKEDRMKCFNKYWYTPGCRLCMSKEDCEKEPPDQYDLDHVDNIIEFLLTYDEIKTSDGIFKLIKKADLEKKKIIPLIANIISNKTTEEYCSSERIAELIYKKLDFKKYLKEDKK